MHVFHSERHIPLNAVHFAILGTGYVSVSRQDKYFVWTMYEFTHQVSYAADILELAGNIMKLWFDDENKNVERIDVVVPIRDENRTYMLMLT